MMEVTAESTQEHGLSAGKSEIAVAHENAVGVFRRKKEASMDAGSKFRGVRRKARGMYAAQIWDPSRRTHVHLGTFVTAEDASKAYDAAAFGLHAAGVVVKKKAAARPEARTEFRGAFRLLKEKRKYAALIWDPSRRTQVRLGKPGTAEEHEDAVQGMRGVAKEHGDAVEGMSEILEENEDAVEVVKACPEARTQIRGVLRVPSGKYRARLWDPLRQKMVHLGTFDTAEDAAKAHAAAAVKPHCVKRFRGVRLEQNGKYSARVWDPVQRTQVHVGTFDTAEDAATAVKLPSVIKAMRTRERVSRTGFHGVRRVKSGKYGARIWDPSRRTQVCLGTFDTPEDAANAYDVEAVRLLGERAITNFKRPAMDLNGFVEQPVLDSFSCSIIPDAQLDDLWTEPQLDDVWTDLPQAELQPVHELLQDMDFTGVAA